jgi:nicotinate phosphoribosyltransferase
VDTYDTLAATRLVIQLAKESGEAFDVRALRLDSGDLHTLSVEVRRLLDEAGLHSVGIFASSSLDEDSISALVAAGAPIDGFGVGTEMGVSTDAPSLDIVYKLVEYAGRGRIKLSTDKPVLPGRKQIFRDEHDGVADNDLLARHDEQAIARPLMHQVMSRGVRLPAGEVSLDDVRRRAHEELGRLPRAIRAITPAEPPYRVDVSEQLERELGRVAARRGQT